MQKHGIKPVIGCEVYVAPRTRFDREKVLDKDYNHLILLCENEKGYKNLIKLVSLSYTEGYYYKPRVDHDILEKYHEGLICLSACLAGEIPQAILERDYEKAKIRLCGTRMFSEKTIIFLNFRITASKSRR